ncbi:sugar ABC transporter permease [Microbacter sp. GSS18]|nr:sugar ABC transporter permease [Microbacter sp. GSS18]
MSLTLTRTTGGAGQAGSPRPPVVRATSRRRSWHSAGAVQSRTGWLFVAPFLILFALFTAIPVATSFAMSFTDIRSREIRNPLAVDFVGFDNFIDVLSDPTFQRALLTTLVFVALCVPLSLVIGFVLALALDTGIRRLRSTFRAVIYVPVIANIVAAAVIWQYAFTPSGPVNTAIESLGVAGPNWFGDPAWAVANVVILSVWRNIGTCMVLFLAGLQAVPNELYEASSLDGAGGLRSAWSITLPLLRPTTLLVSVLMTVAFLNIFEEPYLLTGGGPLGSTRSIALWVYEQFGFGNVAGSMAGSFILLLLVGIVALVQFRVLRPKH